MPNVTRRHYLRTLGLAGIAGLAGCSSDSGDDTSTETVTDGQTMTTPASGTNTLTPTATLTPTTTSTDSPAAPMTATAQTPASPSPTPASSVTFVQQTKIAADDGDENDKFGSSAAVSSDGTTAIIAASRDDGSNGDKTGSAYVFEQSGGSWSQQAKLTPDDGDSSDLFGSSVAVSDDGTTTIIGAYFDEDPNGTWAGSAYVFELSDGSWSQQAKLTPDDGDSNDTFGRSVAVSSDGTIALIGAYTDEDPNGSDDGSFTGAGSAYVFEWSGGSWSQQVKLVADDGDSYDWFGISVAVSDDGRTVIIGAPIDEDPNGAGDRYGGGSAYVFESSDGSWSQQTKLAASDGDTSDNFGVSVAVSSDGATAIIGASRDEDPNGSAAGSAYVFEDSDGSWNQQAKLSAGDGDSADKFGSSVAMSDDGTAAIISAPYDEDPNGRDAGSAYMFEQSGGSWSQQAKLTPDDGDSSDLFGWSVGMSDDGSAALVGARSDEDPNGSAAGSAYVFEI